VGGLLETSEIGRINRPQIHSDFQSAYLSALAEVYYRPEFENAPRGQHQVEVLGVCYQVENPVQRHVEISSRRTNIVFCFAELLWYLSGSDLVADIAHYAPGIKKFSADGIRLTGTAYGPRIFRSGGEAIDQWAAVRRELVRDPDSKRAVMMIYEPREALVEHNIDVACTLALQFFIRNGELHCHTYMRANDAFVGAVSDVFTFTAIQEIMALELGLKVGRFVHNVGSYQLFIKNRTRASGVLQEAAATGGMIRNCFPPMPPGDNWPDIKIVIAYTAELRSNLATHIAPPSLDVNDYWRQVAALFYLYEQYRRGISIDQDTMFSLDRVFRVMLSQRWPDQFNVD
jgi:thymidylate synthase